MQVGGITDSVCASSVCFSVSYLSNCCVCAYQNGCLTDSKAKRNRAEVGPYLQRLHKQVLAGVEMCLPHNTLEYVFCWCELNYCNLVYCAYCWYYILGIERPPGRTVYENLDFYINVRRKDKSLYLKVQEKRGFCRHLLAGESKPVRREMPQRHVCL